jgi:hypothetical protein
MKKLIVLFAILAMVNVASAGVVDIVITSLNGEPITPTSEITIKPTDEVDMQITFTGPATEYAFGVGVTLNVTGPGTLNIAGAARNALYEAWAEVIGADSIIEATATSMGPQGTGQPVVLVGNLLLHCDAIGNVTVVLTNDPISGMYISDAEYGMLPFDFGAGVIIHQVPEPMTLTLLGLGSLFLARRKK